MDARAMWGAGRRSTPFEPNVSMDVVEVWRDDRDLLWRWRYRGHDGTELVANRAHPSRESAVEAAGLAYPGVLIRDRPGPPPRATHRLRAAAVLLLVLLVGASAGVGLLLLAMLAAAVAAVRARSRGRA